MSKKLPSMFWIFVAFIPWIIFWSLSGAGLWTAALTAGVIASLILNGWRASQRNIKTMEVITLIYFVIHFTITLIFNSPFFKDYGVILNSLTLALMAFGSMLAKSPFTYQYARDDWDKAYWGDPNFLLINQIISGVWGVIFVINAALGGVAVFALSGSTLLLTVILPNVLIGVGIFFSAKFPDWFLRIGIQRIIEAREPYKWQAPIFNHDRPTDSNTHDVIVIGSGIGGLTAAALLAKRGRKVIVFEQHFLAGGFCTSWERGVRKGDERWRYVFDAGVHDISGLGERGTVRHLLKQLEIEDRIEWKRTSHEYFLGSTHIKIPHDVNEFVCQLGKEFPSEAENIKKFFAEMKCIYREMYSGVEKTGGIPRAPDTVEEMLAYPKENPHAYKWMDVKFGAMLDQFFSDAKLKELLSALTGYLSDDATKLTVGAMAPIFGYYFDGGFYPLGGSQAFADALVQVIEENGGTVRLRTPVDRIVIEKGRAVGVQLKNGEQHRAQAIISNADVRRTFLEMVGREHLSPEFTKQIESLKSSTSAFMVFLGADCVPSLESITMVDDIGITIPSKDDLSLAPGGHSSITLIKLIPPAEAATWDRRAPDYLKRKHKMGDEMIATAEEVIPNLRQHITYRQEAAPPTFARYAWTTQGEIYGPAYGEARPPHKTPIERLYLTGAGAFGGGIEAVVISGMIAADAILK